MKKMILLLCACIAGISVYAKDDIFNVSRNETERMAWGNNFKPERYRDPLKIKSRLCWIPATVLVGSGGMICFMTLVFNPLSHERDPVRVQQIKNEQRTQLIIGGSMMAASIPLFILARHYRNQGMYGTVLQLKLEPVDRYYGQSSTVAAIGVTIGL